MKADRHTSRGQILPKILQIMTESYKLCTKTIYQISASQLLWFLSYRVHRQTDIIPKLCFSDSGRSKTWRFVKISSSNFLTITILSLYEKVKSSRFSFPKVNKKIQTYPNPEN